MAKLHGAAKKAFIARMAAGRKKITRSRRRKNPLSALVVNPSTRRRKRRAGAAIKKPVERTKGRMTMVKRRKSRRKSRARRVSAPKRIVRRRRRVAAASPTRRRRRSRRPVAVVTRRRKHRRTPSRIVYMGRRNKRRHSRRRNPSSGGGVVAQVKLAFMPFLVGTATAGVAAMLDSGLSKWPVVRNLSKVGAVVVVAVALRKNRRMADAAIGALGASIGYPLVTQLTGGMFAHTPAQAVQGLAEMSNTHPEMGALLQGGMGALLQGGEDGMGALLQGGDVTNVDDVAVNYETALSNMSGFDDDE